MRMLLKSDYFKFALKSTPILAIAKLLGLCLLYMLSIRLEADLYFQISILSGLMGTALMIGFVYQLQICSEERRNRILFIVIVLHVCNYISSFFCRNCPPVIICCIPAIICTNYDFILILSERRTEGFGLPMSVCDTFAAVYLVDKRDKYSADGGQLGYFASNFNVCVNFDSDSRSGTGAQD